MSSEFLSYIKTDISQTRYYPRTLAEGVTLSENYEASELENDDLEPAPGENIEVSIGKLHKSILDNEKVSSTAITSMAESIGLTNTFEFQSSKFPDKTNLIEALESLGGGGGVEETTYSDLNDLKTNSSLSPGTWYCVTDYTGQNWPGGSNVSSNGLTIKIFIMALTTNVLSEDGYGVYNNNFYKIKYKNNIITEMLDPNNNLTCYDSVNLKFNGNATFGTNCSNNTIMSFNVKLGDSCSYITVGKGCQNITLNGTFENVTIENNTRNLTLTCSSTQKNIVVHSCANDSSQSQTINKTNDNYLLEIAKDSSGKIIQYCLADLIQTAVYISSDS